MDELKQNAQEIGSSSDAILTLDICLTKEEIATCLKKSTRHSGKVRVWVQTAILVFVCIYSLVPYLMGEEGNSLLVAMASLLVLAILWMVPYWRYRREVREIAEKESVVHLQLYEDSLIFGHDNVTTVKLDACEPLLCGDLLILAMEHEVVGIPRRLTGEDGWLLLLKKLSITKENPAVEG